MLVVEGVDASGTASLSRSSSATSSILKYGAYQLYSIKHPVPAHMTRSEVSSMDSCQLSLLEMAAVLLDNWQISRDLDTGVYVGMSGLSSSFSNSQMPALGEMIVQPVTSAALSTAAGRISFVNGLTGPSLVTDTACSSTIVAMHLAAAWVCGLALN